MMNKKGKVTLLLEPAVGDWTSFRPRITDKNSSPLPRGSFKLSDEELYLALLKYLSVFQKFSSLAQKDIETPIVIRSVSAQQLTPQLTIKEIEMPVIQFKAGWDSGDSAFICLDFNLANHLINRSVGSLYQSQFTKELTELEKSILEVAVAKNIASALPSTGGTAKVTFQSAPTVTFDHTVPETSVFTVFNIETGLDQDRKGDIMLIIPSTKLFEGSAGEPRTEPDPARIMSLSSDKLFVDAVVELGRTTISAKDLMMMEEGDVLVLDNKLQDLVSIRIGEHLKLKGQPGIKDDRLSIRLLNNGGSRIEIVRDSEPLGQTAPGTEQVSEVPEETEAMLPTDEMSEETSEIMEAENLDEVAEEGQLPGSSFTEEG